MATMLITGASRGVGLALARLAAARGDTVLAAARDPSAEPLKALEEEHRAAVQPIRLDVTDARAAEKIAAKLELPIDLLVCNAGVYHARGPMESDENTPDIWAETLAVNVAGVFFTIRAFLPNVRAARGRIAIISSRMGSSRSLGGSYLYRASKAAASNLAFNLASDLAAEGVAVGAYHPGWVRTEMGGVRATVTPEESAAGLLDRFDALTVERSGVFEDFRGERIEP